MGIWLHVVARRGEGVSPDDMGAWLGSGGDGGRAIAEAGGSVWGYWEGRRGLGFRSDEFVVSTWWPDEVSASRGDELVRGGPVAEASSMLLRPTARPLDAAPCSGEGVWVFRDFATSVEHIDRFVELSSAAWETFERDFDALVRGLFRTEVDEDGEVRFLLVTRYADLATWEASRRPDPAAAGRFGERFSLTRWTRGRSARRVGLG